MWSLAREIDSPQARAEALASAVRRPSPQDVLGEMVAEGKRLWDDVRAKVSELLEG